MICPYSRNTAMVAMFFLAVAFRSVGSSERTGSGSGGRLQPDPDVRGGGLRGQRRPEPLRRRADQPDIEGVGVRAEQLGHHDHGGEDQQGDEGRDEERPVAGALHHLAPGGQPDAVDGLHEPTASRNRSASEGVAELKYVTLPARRAASSTPCSSTPSSSSSITWPLLPSTGRTPRSPAHHRSAEPSTPTR